MEIKNSLFKVLSTSVIATAFTLGIGITSTYAEDPVITSDEEISEEQQTDQSNTENSAVDPDNSSVEVETEQEDEDSSEDEPSLLPGDFFYFFKTMTESIQLAITFDDTEEALLLTEFTQERIAEAEALLEEGEEELAKEVLQKAVEQQEQAFEEFEDAQSEESEESEETTDPAEETDETTDPIEETDETTDEDNSSLLEELEAKFSKNISALTLVLDKIENEKARAAIEKNIAKAVEKLDKKISKKLAKLAVIDDEEPVDEDNLENDNESEETTDTNSDIIEEDTESATEVDELDDSKVVEEEEDQEIVEEVQTMNTTGKTAGITTQKIVATKIEQPKEKKVVPQPKVKEENDNIDKLGKNVGVETVQQKDENKKKDVEFEIEKEKNIEKDDQKNSDKSHQTEHGVKHKNEQKDSKKPQKPKNDDKKQNAKNDKKDKN